MLKTKLDGENIEAVNKAIAKHYKTHAKEIIEALCYRHQMEEFYFGTSNEYSYDQGHQELAIIGIFRAIDGICADKLNEAFFIKKRMTVMSTSQL